MTHEVELKIQAYLDNELAAAERQQISELIRTDGEAQKVYEALAATKAWVTDNEPEHKLPESREFYWSKIEREIRQQTAPVQATYFGLDFGNWWVRLATACAAVALVGTLAILGSRSGTMISRSYEPQEMELPEEMSAITFHSQSANMTVVWVQARFDPN